MKALTLFTLLIFCLGASAGYALNTITHSDKQLPSALTEVIPSVLASEPSPRDSPGDRIRQEQILVYSDRVILDIKDAEWAQFTDTHSMEPVLSVTSNAIEMVPRSPDELKVGDIISYESEFAQGTYIHRIIETGTDDDGWFCIVKGDNNPSPDPGRIRFSQVRRVVAAIIY